MFSATNGQQTLDTATLETALTNTTVPIQTTATTTTPNVNTTTTIPITSDCPSCRAPFRLNTARVSCPTCSFTTCLRCAKKYLLTQRIPQCMNDTCHRSWVLCIRTLLPASFLDGTYRKYRAVQLMEREKMLLPHTQDRANAVSALSTIGDTIKRLQRRARRYILLQTRIRNGGILQPTDAYIDNSDDEEAMQHAQEATHAQESTQQTDNTHMSAKASVNDANKTTAQYIRPCPQCPGFLHFDTWACGLCQTRLCSHCHVVIIRPVVTNSSIIAPSLHVCREEDVATALLVMQRTRPCPKCYTPGQRDSSGICSTVFCQHCNAVVLFVAILVVFRFFLQCVSMKL